MAASTRTVIEYLVILIAIGFFFGGSKLQGFSSDSNRAANAPDVSVLHSDAPRSLTYVDESVACPKHRFDVRIFSHAPLIVYIPDFISKGEAADLVDLAEPYYTPSTIANNGETLDTSIRKSDRAELPHTDTVKCIERRALSFQGWPEDTFIERLALQRYIETGFYGNHYDWATANPKARRTSTFMVYVFANCTGGGTNFPLLQRPRDRKWCEFIECEDSNDGVTFLPKPGAAVFWQNFDADGRGWKESLHAGMPVVGGVKMGLNIWSWYQKGHRPPVEPAV